MKKSKIHRATVTDANLNYEGSITIDRDLLEAADILNISSTTADAIYNNPDVIDVVLTFD